MRCDRRYPVVGIGAIDEAGSFDELTQRFVERDSEVDLMLLDLAMPGMRGFSGLMYLRAQYPSDPGGRRVRER